MTDSFDARRMRCCCFDCGRAYGCEYGFPDLVIPDDDWRAISPTKDFGGLLCPSCICRRLYDAGVSTAGIFVSGALCEGSEPPAARVWADKLRASHRNRHETIYQS